jgi:hypothetical protein
MSPLSPIIETRNEKENKMEKETKNLLLIYVLPILVLSLGLGAVHPMFAQVVLFMLGGASLLCLGMVFLIDWYEKRN